MGTDLFFVPLEKDKYAPPIPYEVFEIEKVLPAPQNPCKSSIKCL